eukprot:158179-Rhodomonas_salina.2
MRVGHPLWTSPGPTDVDRVIRRALTALYMVRGFHRRFSSIHSKQPTLVKVYLTPHLQSPAPSYLVIPPLARADGYAQASPPMVAVHEAPSPTLSGHLRDKRFLFPPITKVRRGLA